MWALGCRNTITDIDHAIKDVFSRFNASSDVVRGHQLIHHRNSIRSICWFLSILIE